MKTYSVVKLTGSMQDVVDEGLTLDEADEAAKSFPTSESVFAVVDDDTDEAVATKVYYKGKSVDPSFLRTVIFGLGRLM